MLDLDKGDKVVRRLTGSGVSIEDVLTVESVNEVGIFVQGADGYYAKDSVYGYDKTGKPLAAGVAGFSSRLVRKALAQGIQDLEEH